jgi:hypothetical protein
MDALHTILLHYYTIIYYTTNTKPSNPTYLGPGGMYMEALLATSLAGVVSICSIGGGLIGIGGIIGIGWEYVGVV